jgi:hypothetical protein
MVDQTVGDGKDDRPRQGAFLEPGSLGILGVAVNGHIEPSELMEDGEVSTIERPAYPTKNFGACGYFTHNKDYS